MQDDRSATDLSIETSRPASADTAVVFAGDEFYARVAMQIARQLHDLYPDRRFDICIAANDVPAAPPESPAHLDLRRRAMRTNGMFEGLRRDLGRTEIAYLRLALPQAFRGENRRILYLDSRPLREPERFRLGISHAGYFNAGVMLIDVARWRDQVRRLLAKHVLSRHRALQHMKRFPDEMTVLP